MLPAWCILFDLWKRADAWKEKRREKRDRPGWWVGGEECRETEREKERQREALVSSSNARLCHLTPATEWARIPCPFGRKLGPADRNSKEEWMQIAAAKGNGCPRCLRRGGRGGQMKMAPASLTDSPLEDDSSIKSGWKFPFLGGTETETTAACGSSMNERLHIHMRAT